MFKTDSIYINLEVSMGKAFRVAIGVSTSIATVAVLSGCVPQLNIPNLNGNHSQSPTPVITDSPAPTPDPTVALDPDVLFVISVTATSPQGAVADLTQTVYKPLDSTNQQATDQAALNDQCSGWQTAYTSPQFIVSQIDVTDRSPAGTSWDSNPVAIVSMDGAPVFTGEFTTFQAFCASVGVKLGSTRGVSPVQSGDPDAIRGWARTQYGFGIATDPQFDLSTTGPYVTLSNCSITLSQFAIDNSPTAASWATLAQNHPLYECGFGEQLAP
ncbi:MAG: hypothetical protein IT191_08030 [Microbacteriaceae bacterium]|nr:hypothetical protein [Microbacteriaceae bacterium]